MQNVIRIPHLLLIRKMENELLHCPICDQWVTKSIITNRDIESDCSNEYGAHVGSKYYKFKTPKGSWEISREYKEAQIEHL